MTYKDYRNLLRISDLHVYLSRPFIASWSLLRRCHGCCIVASDLEMCREISQDSAFYVNHKNHADSVEKIMSLLNSPQKMQELSLRARELALTMDSGCQVERLARYLQI